MDGEEGAWRVFRDELISRQEREPRESECAAEPDQLKFRYVNKRAESQPILIRQDGSSIAVMLLEVPKIGPITVNKLPLDLTMHTTWCEPCPCM